jgi:hypothetical protein
MKGWAEDFASWELAGNGHSSSNDNTLRYRQGCGSTWGDWQTVLTNKNIGSYADARGSCLPLSGGGLTGSLMLHKTQWWESNGAYCLNCQNSDIIGVNGIYFDDAADTAGEAINFYSSSTAWDSLYAKDGVLKFHPNRAKNVALNGDTVYTASNLRFRRGTCTLNCNTPVTVNFSPALSVTPTVMLTPLTTTGGVIAGKVNSVNTSGFTAVIGGSAISGDITFAYLAVYHS